MSSENTELKPDIINQLSEANSDDQKLQLLIVYLQAKITKILNLESSNPPDPDKLLNELGLDSLTSIQLRNSVNTELKVNLSRSKFLVEASINKLANSLLQQLVMSNLFLSKPPSSDMNNELGGNQNRLKLNDIPNKF